MDPSNADILGPFFGIVVLCGIIAYALGRGFRKAEERDHDDSGDPQ